jgi:hypothetical protein
VSYFSIEGVLEKENVFTGIVFCFTIFLTLCKKKAGKNISTYPFIGCSGIKLYYGKTIHRTGSGPSRNG